MDAFYRQLDHTGDCGIVVWGDSKAALYANAARAMLDLLVGLERIEITLVRLITVHGSDAEALLVAWLDELLFLFETEFVIFGEVDVTLLSDTELCATVRGEPYRPADHQYRVAIKAVTFHQLQIREDARGWTAQIIFDL